MIFCRGVCASSVRLADRKIAVPGGQLQTIELDEKVSLLKIIILDFNIQSDFLAFILY